MIEIWSIIPISLTKIQGVVIMGSVINFNLEVMVDSGASIFLLTHASAAKMTNTIEKPIPKLLLKTASGMQLLLSTMSQYLFSYKI